MANGRDVVLGHDIARDTNPDDLIVIAGAGGFIAGSLTRYFHDLGYRRIRAIDRKPLPEWYQRVPDVECLRSVLINTNMIEAAYRAGARRYFFSSSACAYNTDLQQSPDVVALKESDAYPAMAERGYGWEKLISEMFCQEYWSERGLETHIARFHNIYGPNGTWDGGREKAPAAMCRKVIEALDTGRHEIDIWGDGTQTRSFCYIDDCTVGIDKIMHSDKLIATPINLGSSELVSINELLSIVEEIAGIKLERRYQLDAPKGVAGRNSDNTFIESVLGWEPRTPLRSGMAATYRWIKGEYEARKAGRTVAVG
jgi:nucleoside-diphosphate-sugar epimerase